ncbi:universal stress protein [Pseudooceanicola sp. 216_PA32_1]|uniref:Universal stress protein n=1 Tax=Pseudooceanicola pacificus TaxID=2676438 RepID=A0A844W807_9RHOB|nr:universal stress protein [Pseudooceanicola pacificus]MWB79275.1 universal stress protein [Pseudooceanicola pacificus]
MYKNILVAVKLEHARPAAPLLRRAAAVAEKGAVLTVMTVVPEISDNLKVLPEDSQPLLDKYVDGCDLDGIEVRTMLRKGSPHRLIPQVAEELDADLIVMNSHNPRIRDYLLGSTAGHVVTHAQCNVLVIRQNAG